MKAKWLGVALGCAVLAGGAAGCGQGRAIFNVDVYSFLKGTGRDTLRLPPDRKSTRLNSSHSQISYAVFCLKKKKNTIQVIRLTTHNISYRYVIYACQPTSAV